MLYCCVVRTLLAHNYILQSGPLATPGATLKKILACLIGLVAIQSNTMLIVHANTYGGQYDHKVVDSGAAGQAVAGGKYKTGDVIEVLYNSVKGWETAVVMPYIGSDYPADRERWLRAYMPSLPNQVQGYEVTIDKVRPGSLSKLNSPESWYAGEVSSIVDSLLTQKLGSQKPVQTSATGGSNISSSPTSTLLRTASSTASPASRVASSTNSTGTSAVATVGSAASNATATSTTPKYNNLYPVTSKPTMNGAVPNLSGTAWKEMFDHSVPVVPLWLFCKSGHWEVVRYAGAVGGMGKWRSGGNTLTLTDSANGKSDNYSMTYDAARTMLFVKGGGVTFRLLYNGTTQCQ